MGGEENYALNQACKFMPLITVLTRWSQDEEFKVLHNLVKEYSSGYIRRKYNKETQGFQTIKVITEISQDDEKVCCAF